MSGPNVDCEASESFPINTLDHPVLGEQEVPETEYIRPRHFFPVKLIILLLFLPAARLWLTVRRMAVRKFTPSSPVAKVKATLQASGRSTKEERRRVSFDETTNQEYKSPEWTGLDYSELWFNQIELALIKQRRRGAIQKVVSQEISEISEPHSYKKVLVRVYDNCCNDDGAKILSPEDAFSLRMWVQRSSSRLGLELVSLPEIYFDKRRRREELGRLVFELQKFHKSGSMEARTQLLRLASESLTESAQRFAHYTAEALTI